MSTNFFSPEDREIIAAHIGEMDLTDDLLERFFASALDQASEKYEKALRGYRSVMSMRRAKDEPPPAPPVVPTPEEAVSDMMVNLRAALDAHTGDDGRAPVQPPRDELQEQIDFIRWVMSSDAPAPAPEPPTWVDTAAEQEVKTDDLLDADEREKIVSGFIDILKTGKSAVEDTFRQLTSDDKVRLFPLLNAELSRLNNQEALLGRSIPRKADVESLIGILARVGEA